MSSLGDEKIKILVGEPSMSAGDEEVEIVVDCMVEKVKKFHERLIKHDEPVICRIPDEIRGNHGSAYEPNYIKIGPYNGGRVNLGQPDMEEIKLQYLINLCKRSIDGDNPEIEDILKIYITAVQKLELNARRRYPDLSFEMSSSDFVQMLVVDGCFIVELFFNSLEMRDSDDRIISKTFEGIPELFKFRNIRALCRDLLLFENQIPFFILKEIYAKTKFRIEDPPNLSLVDLAVHFLYMTDNITQKVLPEEYRRDEEPIEIHHLLHLSHLCLVNQLYVPEDSHIREAKTLLDHLFIMIGKFIKAIFKYSKFILLTTMSFWFNVFMIWKWPFWKHFRLTDVPPDDELRDKIMSIPTAMQLNEAGVSLRKKITSKCYIHVTFEDGIMEIPNIPIDDYTSSEYRNLLALEQSWETYGDQFKSYVWFMGKLINTTDDVALLMESKIIDNNLGSAEDIVKFYKEIGIGLQFIPLHHSRNLYWAILFVKINTYCEKTYNKWRAKLKRDYLTTPWSVISLLAALLLIGLVAVQTVYSIIGFQVGNNTL